jgi:hypothetical protein
MEIRGGKRVTGGGKRKFHEGLSEKGRIGLGFEIIISSVCFVKFFLYPMLLANSFLLFSLLK